MCLAIHKPAETRPDWIAYANGYRSNPHSWGFAAIHDGHLVVMHGLGSFDEFRLAFEPYADCQAIIHYRWATHGKTDLDNCHPFMVSNNLAMIHNGIVSIERNVNSDRSDTWHFNELILKPMHERDPDFFLRGDMIYTQEMAHADSKFVFLRADGDFAIWNSGEGEVAADGHWYSNSSHKSLARIGYATSKYTDSTGWRDMSPSDRSPLTYASRKADDADRRYEQDDLIGGCSLEASVEPETGVTLIRDPYYGEYDPIEDADDDEEQLADMMWSDLRTYGISSGTLKEVYHMFGNWGIQALYDCM